ncbi:3-hydroxyisobutyrate dehydrogenase [Rubellimicrobium thermophilum DSM 16684]|uniref:3-hydroxyisobutyrate dehydrogenase n=1 Tax=Rubellimicrobium thermophilum DSM 16684 TaxID=1123069 RepID=S9SIG5_9RHOB|nr:3-hydroxyisobutyrate dehydrogenase [Rubellimicrobium thermophilum DSM 16684]
MAERVGFVGVGLMGHGMAHNILTKGHPLTVIAHRRREAVNDLVARGAHEAATLTELAERSDVVVLCLTGSPQVEETVGGLLPGLRSGESLVIDCSTSDPVSTDRLGAMLRARGIGLVDAPLSRTPKEAWEGTLDVMMGAEDRDLARAERILRLFAARILHVGGPGAGHRMKLINNFISLGYGALYAEALALARKAGIGVAAFDSVIRDGRMDCAFYRTFMGYALEGNREAHRFTLSNAAKDLRYLEAMANAAGVPTTLASAVKNSYVEAVAAGRRGAGGLCAPSGGFRRAAKRGLRRASPGDRAAPRLGARGTEQSRPAGAPLVVAELSHHIRPAARERSSGDA